MIFLIEDSEKPNPHFAEDPELCPVVHCHHHLEKMFDLLWKNIAPRGSFVDLVFRLVAFHQSLQGVPAFQPIVSLTQ